MSYNMGIGIPCWILFMSIKTGKKNAVSRYQIYEGVKDRQS